MTARGEKIRSDDNPEVLKGRLFAYREQTAPLVGYYASKGLLERVDGMAAVDDVSAQISRILAPAKAPRAPRKAGRKSTAKAAPKAAAMAAPKSKSRAGRRRKSKAAKAIKAGKRTARKGSARRTRPTATRRKNKPGQRKNRTRRRLTRT